MNKRKISLSIVISFTIIITSFFNINHISAQTYDDWAIIDGVKYFHNSNGEQIGTANAKRVIDVSEHQKTIDWSLVKSQNTGALAIDGAILRLGYGSAREDYQLANNLNGVRSNGIPYGAYLYSYANDTAGALEEAKFVEQMIIKHGLQNTEYPIYYDIERFDSYQSNGVTVSAPTSAQQYEEIILTFINYLNSKGYHNIQVYSYTSYINSYLNNPKILPYLGWIAEYAHNLHFNNTMYNGLFGWQYSSKARIAGIEGNVDVNCFYNKVDISSVPEKVAVLLQSQSMQFDAQYVSGFYTKPDKVADNVTFMNNLNSGEYNVSIHDSSGTQIIYTDSLPVQTGYILKFHRKDEAQLDLEDFSLSLAVKGDINGDGVMTPTDYVLVRNQINGKGSLSGVTYKACDVDWNGQITPTDYVLLRNYLNGRNTRLDR